MKLSDLKPEEVQVVSRPEAPPAPTGGLRLSDIHPDEVEHVSSPKAPTEDISQIESAIRGGVQGLTAGFSDELAGGVQAAGSAISHPIDNAGKLTELYRQYRDLERQRNEAAEKANPMTYMAGNVAGGVGSMALGLGELGAGVKGAAAIGALSGLGASNADLTKGEIGRAAIDTGIGGAIGGAAGKVGKVVGKMLSPAALEEAAASNVGNALGAKGLPSQVQKVGKAAIGSGALNDGLNEGTLGGLRQAATDTEGKLQPILAQIKDGLSSKTPEEVSEALGGDAGDKVLDLMHSAMGSMKDMSQGVTDNFGEKIAPKIQDYVQKLKAAGNDPVRLNEIKRAAYKEAQDAYDAINKAQRSGQALPPEFEQWAGMAKQIGSAIKNQIEALGGLVDPALEQSLKATNETAGGLAGAKSALTSKLMKGDGGIKTSNPIEYAYNPKWALIKDTVKNLNSDAIRVGKANTQMGMANKLSGTVGESLSAPGAKIAQATTGSIPVISSAQEFTGGDKVNLDRPAELSRSLYNQSDDQLKSVADTMGQSPGFEHVAASLNNALANKDNQAKNSALFLLSQNPQARKILKERGLINTSN